MELMGFEPKPRTSAVLYHLGQSPKCLSAKRKDEKRVLSAEYYLGTYPYGKPNMKHSSLFPDTPYGLLNTPSRLLKYSMPFLHNVMYDGELSIGFTPSHF